MAAASSSSYSTELIRAHFHLRVSPERIAQAPSGREMLDRCCAAYGFSCPEVWYQLVLVAWMQTHKFMSSAMATFLSDAGVSVAKNLVSRRFSMSDALAFLMLDEPKETENARATMEQLFGYTFFPGRNERLLSNLMGDVVPRLQAMHSRAVAASASASAANTEPEFKFPVGDLAACTRFFAAYFAARLKPPARRTADADAAPTKTATKTTSKTSKTSARCGGAVTATATAAATATSLLPEKERDTFVMMLKRPRKSQVEFCVDGSLIRVNP